MLPGFFEKAMNLATRYPDAGVVFGRLQHKILRKYSQRERIAEVGQ